MLEILFGWITKPHLMWNIIDAFICAVEILLLIILLLTIYAIVETIKENKKDKQRRK